MPKNKPKVSVVVPIYNVERYLKECVDSILNQTLKEIEVILVDDGSPDNCGKIVDEYAKKDSRVVAIHQKNSGYSVAVNKGIDVARGEYVGIIESDDYIDPQMYETLYENAKKNNTEITKSLFYYYNPTLDAEHQNIIWKNPSGVDLRLAPSKAFTVKEWPQIIGFHASIWSSIYKAELIKSVKIPETAGASYQDFPFMVEIMMKAKSISVVKKAFLHWRNEPSQGNSTSAKGKKLLLMVENNNTCLELIDKYGMYDQLKEAFFAHVIWANMDFYYRVGRENRKEYYDKMRQLLSRITNDETFTYKFFRPIDKTIVRLFTVKGGRFLLGIKPIGGKIKRFALSIFRSISPSYKILVYLRQENEELKLKNDLIMEELLEIKDIIDSKA